MLKNKLFDGLKKFKRQLFEDNTAQRDAANLVYGISRSFSRSVRLDALKLARAIKSNRKVTSAAAIRVAALIQRTVNKRRQYLTMQKSEVGLSQVFGVGATIDKELVLCDLVTTSIERVI